MSLSTLVQRTAVSLALAPAALLAQRTYHPTVTDLSPQIVTVGTNITITGTDLAPLGWQLRYQYAARYSGGGGIHVQSGCCVSSSQIAIPAEGPMRGDSLRLIYFPLTADTAQNPIPVSERTRFISQQFVVVGPPDLTFVGNQVTPDIGPNFRLLALAPSGQGLIKGMMLRRTALPTVRINSTNLTVLAHNWEAGGDLYSLSGSSVGADRVFFTLPTQKISGYLVIENSLGRDSAAVTYSPPPAPLSQVLLQTSSGTSAAGTTLRRGSTYVIRGQNLSITHTVGGTSVKRGVPQLNGTSITPSFASDTNIVFTVPTTIALGTASLGVTTPAGSATVGSFTVADPPLPIDVVSLTPVPPSLLVGETRTFVATLNIPGGAKSGLGNLLVTTPGTPPGALKIKSIVPVTGPTTEVKVEGGDLQVTTPVTLRVVHEANGVNGVTTQAQQVTFNIRVPHPVQILAPSAVTAGATTDFSVLFDTASYSSNVFTLLSSSNPNVVPVPASAILGKNKALFTATVPPAAQPGGTATLTATLDGASASLPVTVQLPRVTQVTSTHATLVPGQVTTVSALLNGSVITGDQVNFSSDTALPAVSPVDANATRTTFRRTFGASTGLSQPRTVTITGTYGNSSSSITVNLVPTVISSFTATPTAATGGTTISATAILSAAAPLSMHMTFLSADTTRATISGGTGSIAPGANSKVASILLKGPVSTPRQVPITAVLRTGGSGGPIVSQQTITVTVNP